MAPPPRKSSLQPPYTRMYRPLLPRVYLSRFCEVRYCIARHCAFLVGRGHSSGDPSVAVQSIEQAIKLLKRPPPWDRDHNVIVGGLEALPTLMEWPAPDTEGEDWLIAAATFLFLEPR